MIQFEVENQFSHNVKIDKRPMAGRVIGNTCERY